MSYFEIIGGNPISGEHIVPGNKNAALPMIAATLLTDEPVTLSNLPLIDDVRVMLALVRNLGAEVELNEEARCVTITAKSLPDAPKLDRALCSKVRGSLLLAGPLLGRLRSVTVPPPGGDVIGRRRLDTHFIGFSELGATIRGNTSFKIVAKELVGREILLDEASVTATENLLMASVLARGVTSISNAACEPHVQNLCQMLNAMGAQISGIGTNRLVVHGVSRLRGVATSIGSDTIEAASYMVAALVTGGGLILKGVSPDDFKVLDRPFRRFGVKYTISGTTLTLPARQHLRTEYDFGKAIPKLEDGIWPAFPSDLMSVFIVLATQARGTMVFFEKMFESRLYFVDHLIGMGAGIIPCDPHRVVVTGPMKLQGAMVSSPDIRAGMALLIAALCAKGKTIINNATSIDRGYAQIEHELRRLGANIRRID